MRLNATLGCAIWRQYWTVGRNICYGLSRVPGLSPGNICHSGTEVIIELLRNHRPTTSLSSFWRENHIGVAQKAFVILLFSDRKTSQNHQVDLMGRGLVLSGFPETNHQMLFMMLCQVCTWPLSCLDRELRFCCVKKAQGQQGSDICKDRSCNYD